MKLQGKIRGVTQESQRLDIYFYLLVVQQQGHLLKAHILL